MDINLTLLAIAIPILALSIAAHEMMHAFVSDSLGDDTARHQGRITLNPLAHIDPWMTIGLPLLLIALGLPPFGAAKPVSFNPYKVRYGEWGIALIAIAGPLTNLLLAVVAGVLFKASADGSLMSDILRIGLSINIGFFVFNMIPFPPLDGSRVLYALAPEPVQRFMEQIEGMGLFGLVLFMFVLFPFLRPVFETVSNFLLNTLT